VDASGAACPGTQLPAFTVDQVKQAVFAEASVNGSSTVGGTFTQCSHGKSPMNAQNSMVADLVELPCSGER